MTLVSLITIGDELLKGRIINTNAARAGILLRKNGFSLNRVVTISDEAEAIRTTIESELATHDLVLMCGGLGPTQDDITKQTLADIFESDWTWHEETLRFIEKRYEGIREVNERTRRQAWVPSKCEVLPNSKGTAPGMCFQREAHRLIAMPGVPFEMLHMLEFEVIPRMKDWYQRGYFDHRIVRLTGLPESEVAGMMKELEEQLNQSVQIAYLPRTDALWIELSIRNQEAAATMEEGARQVEEIFGDHVVATGANEAAELLLELCKKYNCTMALAESLTGGKLAAKIVAVSGASAHFLGSVTAYDPEIKRSVLQVSAQTIATKGVVSAEVAEQMARGVRDLMKADFAIATTGIAQPGEAAPPQVWLAYVDSDSTTHQFVRLMQGRAYNQERAAYHALWLAIKNVRKRFA